MAFVKIDVERDTRQLLGMMKSKFDHRSYNETIRYLMAYYLDPGVARAKIDKGVQK